jgi:5'-phosphate synthase pdxT subunit
VGAATTTTTATTIGVLNLQGDVREHVAALAQLGVASQLIKRPADLAGIDGLILPGGESTTLSMLLESTDLFDPVAALLEAGLPVLGTCAGLVLLAGEVLDGRPDQRSFAALDAVVRRNGFGRQVASFETALDLAEGPPMPAVFIRAPFVVSVGPGVEVLASVRHRASGHDGVPVASPALVRQGNVLACCFHPELTGDRRVHRLFVELCGARSPGGASAV